MTSIQRRLQLGESGLAVDSLNGTWRSVSSSMLRFLARAIRRRPKTTIVVTLLAVVAAGYLYAQWQWRSAQLALTDNRPVDARRHLELCLWVWPRSVPAHLLAARAARQSGDFVAAESHLTRCLKLQQGASEAVQVEFLLLRAQTGEADEVAIPLLEYIETKEEERERILQTLARSFMHHLRYGPAYVCLTRWIDIKPDAAQPCYWRGWVLERLNNSEGAMKDYLRGLEIEPDSVKIRLRVAEMYVADNKPKQALTHLERLRQLAPDRADIVACLGQCRYLQGDHAEARQLLEAAARELPDSIPVLVHLAKLDIEAGKALDAEARLRRVVKIDFAYAEAHYLLVSALQLLGRNDEAKASLAEFQKYTAVLEQANKLLKQEAQFPTNDPNVASEIGRLLLQIGHDRSGGYWLDQALLRDPHHQATHRAYAEFFETKGLSERAAAHRRRLTK